MSDSYLRKILKALPTMIPYIGDVYSSVTDSVQLDAVNKNIERILQELRIDVFNNSEMINEIIEQLNKHRNPKFNLNSGVDIGRGLVEYLLSFTLSNTGGSIIHVRKIWLELLSTGDCEEIQSLRI